MTASVLPNLTNRNAEQDKKTLRQAAGTGLVEYLGALEVNLLRELGDFHDLTDARASRVQGAYQALSDLLKRIHAA